MHGRLFACLLLSCIAACLRACVSGTEYWDGIRQDAATSKRRNAALASATCAILLQHSAITAPRHWG